MKKWANWLGLAFVVAVVPLALWTNGQINDQEAACALDRFGGRITECSPSTTWWPVVAVGAIGLLLLVAVNATRSRTAE